MRRRRPRATRCLAAAVRRSRSSSGTATPSISPGAVHLAQSPLCKHQAFRVGDCAYGLQFHIEMTAAMVNDWLAEPDNCGELAALDYIDTAAIRAAAPAKLPRLQSWHGKCWADSPQFAGGK